LRQSNETIDVGHHVDAAIEDGRPTHAGIVPQGSPFWTGSHPQADDLAEGDSMSAEWKAWLTRAELCRGRDECKQIWVAVEGEA
jgi:hypothetical protein